MSKTQEDLKAAFAGESQANRKYLAFAKAAEKEGKTNLAKLFRAVAEGETVHALKHLTNLGEVKDSVENLKAAIAGETYEIESMYPGFIADAQADGEKVAEIGFYGANEVEKIHQKEFIAAFGQIENGIDIEGQKYFVCQICGKLELGEAPEFCSICKAPKASFNEIV
ncbi:MAG: rubrerythrin family protein [Candidatus Moranbacteria bacterium]|nr:rubrerythrin family protein [Candidatus Moranbacteria bacterium]